MYEDALSLPLVGTQVYVYGLAVMLGCWLAIALLVWLTRGQQKERLAIAYTALLALPLGFVLARLLFVLLDPGFAPLLSVSSAWDVSTGGFAMYGALCGAVLAALLAAKITKLPWQRLLDLLAPAIAAFLIPARLGEGATALGLSRPLTTPFIAESFLAQRDAYDAYLRTYVIEALVAAVLLLVLLRALARNKKSGQVFALFCLLYGLSQTLMESLRYDGHLRYSFVGVQQVLSVTLFAVTMIVLAVRLLRLRKGRVLPAAALIALPLILAAILGIEFLIDRSELGKLFSYALYLLVLAIAGSLGILLLKQEGPHVQADDGAHQ